jgi:dsDNA-specific endonuclease/ATPase MutS2
MGKKSNTGQKMEQILIQVSNKEKAKILLELLESLDFVDFIEAKVKEESDVEKILPSE